MQLDSSLIDEVHNVLVAPFKDGVERFCMYFLRAIEAALRRLVVSLFALVALSFAHSNDVLVEHLEFFQVATAETTKAVGESVLLNYLEECALRS